MNEETNIETEDETIATPSTNDLDWHPSIIRYTAAEDECDCFECKQGLECVIPF